MDEHERGLAPLNEGIWPPAPLHDDLLPLFLRLEGMQLTRSGDRLVVLNKSIRRLFVVEICILSTSLLSPWISFLTSSFYHATLPSLLSYVASNHRLPWENLFSFSALVGIWWLLTIFGNMRGATLDRGDQSVEAGGKRARPMSRIEAVQVKPMPNTFLGRQYTVSLQWGSDDPTPRRRRAITSAPGNRCFLGALRQEAHAEEVAAIIAEFAKVSVQRG